MAKITFLDPTVQSAYNTLKAEITQKKTGISIQLHNTSKDYDKLVQADTSKHEKRHLLTGIEYKLDTIQDFINHVGNVTSKAMTLVMNTEPDGVAQKASLKQEEVELQAGLDAYGDKLREFNRSKSETLERIHAEVNPPSGGREFVTP